MCAKQHFGHGCQYYDVTSQSITQSFATDGDRTCNLVADATSTVIKWNATYASHRIRVVFESPGQFHNLRLWLNSLELCQWKTFSCEWIYSRCLLHHLCSFDTAGALWDRSQCCVLQLCLFQTQIYTNAASVSPINFRLSTAQRRLKFLMQPMAAQTKSWQLLYLRLTKNWLGENSSWIDLMTWHGFT